jgi:hypothetical protein
MNSWIILSWNICIIEFSRHWQHNKHESAIKMFFNVRTTWVNRAEQMFLLRCVLQIPNQNTTYSQTDNVKRFAYQRESRIVTGISKAFCLFTGLLLHIKAKLGNGLISGRSQDSSVGIRIGFGLDSRAIWVRCQVTARDFILHCIQSDCAPPSLLHSVSRGVKCYRRWE